MPGPLGGEFFFDSHCRRDTRRQSFSQYTDNSRYSG